MDKLPLEYRYRAVQEKDGSWSVMDSYTQMELIVDDELMILLSESDAIGLADIMNHNDLTEPTVH